MVVWYGSCGTVLPCTTQPTQHKLTPQHHNTTTLQPSGDQQCKNCAQGAGKLEITAPEAPGNRETGDEGAGIVWELTPETYGEIANLALCPCVGPRGPGPGAGQGDHSDYSSARRQARRPAWCRLVQCPGIRARAMWDAHSVMGRLAEGMGSPPRKLALSRRNWHGQYGGNGSGNSGGFGKWPDAHNSIQPGQ
eukprot:gene21081-biopygen4127